MTELFALWLPILVSAVIVFVASAIIHMAPLWHKNNFPALPDQEAFRAAVGPMAIPPGDYMVPRASGGAEMRSPEFEKKISEGPVMMMTVLPNRQFAMGSTFALWFVHLLVIGIFSAYIAAAALAPGADPGEVCRFAGATAFFCHAVAVWPMSIWYKRAWSLSLKETLDALIYGLITGAVFAWLWPGN